MADFSRSQSLLQRFPLLWIALGAVAAIWADRWLAETGQWSCQWRVFLYGTTLVTSAVVFVAFRAKFLSTGSNWLIGIVCFATLAATWHLEWTRQYASVGIHRWIGTEPAPTIIRGRIHCPVTVRENPMSGERRDVSSMQSQLEVSVGSVRDGIHFVPTNGRVLAFVDDDLSHFRPGDEVEIYGTIQAFDRPTNPGEPDLTPVFRRRNLHGRVDVRSAQGIVRTEKSDGWVWPAVAAIAQHGRETLFRHTDAETGPLAVALVIGQREFVDQPTRDALLATGTMHLLSVSGLHLAIIVFLASWIADVSSFRFPVKSVWLFAVCAMYVAITGARPPVMRAAVLVVAVLVALWIRRPAQPLNSLGAAALVLIIANPLNVFAVGVHLSFLAVVTLMLCGRRLDKPTAAAEKETQVDERFDALAAGADGVVRRYSKRLFKSAVQLAWFSGCVSVMSLPLVWHQFHLVSWISVFANVLLTPGLLVALPAGVLTVFTGFFSDGLAMIPGSICNLSLWYMRAVIDVMASIKFGHAWLPAPPTWWVAVFYLAMAASLTISGASVRTYRVVGCAVWFFVAWWVSTTVEPKPVGSIEATFVDVGHGTSVIARMPDDSVWLYDCGYLGNETNSCRKIDSAIWALGVTHLDGVIVSHADADHYNALPGLLRRFSVGKIYTSPGMLEQGESGLIPIRQSIQRYEIPVVEIHAGQSVGEFIRVLHPPIERVAGNDNANSLALRIDCGGKSLVLPGDLEEPGTPMLLDQVRPHPGGVLMAPHHGSLSSDAAAVLQWSRPGEVVVSGGRRAKRAAVTESLGRGGSVVHVTASTGACRVRILADGSIRVRNWTQQAW